MTFANGSELSGDPQTARELLPEIEAFMALDAAALEHGFDYARLLVYAHGRYVKAGQDPDNNWQKFLNAGVDALPMIDREGLETVTETLLDFLRQNPGSPQAPNPA